MISMSLRTSTWHKALVAFALVLIFAFGAIAPGSAETAGQRSTRNIILGAVAVAAGIVIYNNIHHKQVAHDTVVGRTADGGIVHADGRITYPDGSVVYTSNNGRNPCAYDGEGEQCTTNARAYAWRAPGDHEWHGHGKGWSKHHGHGDNEGNHNEGNHGGDSSGGDNQG